MVNQKKEFLENLEAISSSFNEAIDVIRQEQEEYWNGLSKAQQLMAFCAVSRRIYQGDIEQRRTYRGVLYDVFEFGPESYVAAQMSGYLTIHNAIYDSMEMEDIIMKFCQEYDISDAKNKVTQFMIKQRC